MNKLSVQIIAKNEEQNIGECLESVKWASEIVVVDDMSTDGTAEICRRYPNVKIYEKKMEGFGSQKDFALSKATGEWVLSLDADERVTPELKEEILDRISTEKYNGYRIRIKHMVFGKWISDHKPRNLRLFKRGRAKFTSKKVHESVILDGAVGELDNLILHPASSYRSLSEYIRVYVNKYSSYTAEDLYGMGRRVTGRNFLLCFVFKPAVIFFQKYFLKNGYREGMRGFLLSVLAAFTYFVSYAKLWEKQNKEKNR